MFQNSETAFATAPASPSQSMMGALPNTPAPNLSLEPDPILFGKLAGRHELRIKIKQGDGVVGPKASTKLLHYLMVFCFCLVNIFDIKFYDIIIPYYRSI